MENSVNNIILKDDLALVFGKLWNEEKILLEQLADEINYLIENDFNKLVFILYKVDVQEEKVRAMLAENNRMDTGRQIALLVIERQLQKIKKRSAGTSYNDIPEADKW